MWCHIITALMYLMANTDLMCAHRFASAIVFSLPSDAVPLNTQWERLCHPLLLHYPNVPNQASLMPVRAECWSCIMQKGTSVTEFENKQSGYALKNLSSQCLFVQKEAER